MNNTHLILNQHLLGRNALSLMNNWAGPLSVIYAPPYQVWKGSGRLMKDGVIEIVGSINLCIYTYDWTCGSSAGLNASSYVFTELIKTMFKVGILSKTNTWMFSPYTINSVPKNESLWAFDIHNLCHKMTCKAKIDDIHRWKQWDDTLLTMYFTLLTT